MHIRRIVILKQCYLVLLTKHKGFDDGMCTIVVFLDLSAAFDTVDTKKLLEILENDIRITANALKWFNSYLTGRTQCVKIKDNYSDSQETPFWSTSRVNLRTNSI